MAENYFLLPEDNSKDDIDRSRAVSEENDIWATPRASWRSTSDGYIDQVKVDSVLANLQGYSKINKNKKYDKIITERAGLVTYNSQIILSYNKVCKMLTRVKLDQL